MQRTTTMGPTKAQNTRGKNTETLSSNSYNHQKYQKTRKKTQKLRDRPASVCFEAESVRFYISQQRRLLLLPEGVTQESRKRLLRTGSLI